MNETNVDKLKRLITNEDSGMRGMGLSMTKGANLTEEISGVIFALSLWDPNDTLREQAKQIISKIDLDKIEPFPKYFEPFFDEKKAEDYNYLDELCDEKERLLILKEIVKIENKKVKPLLLDALDKESRESWNAVGIICKVLQEYRDDGTVRRKLIKLIKKSRYGESHLIDCLAQVGCGEQITELIPLLDNKMDSALGNSTLFDFMIDQNVIEIIKKDHKASEGTSDEIIHIRRMGVLGDTGSVHYLENITRSTDDEKIKTAAIGSLGKIMSTISIGALKRLREEEKGMLVQRLIDGSIEKIEYKMFQESLIEEKKKRDERIRKWKEKN